MRIDASGNVGIGTSSPQARLQVNVPSGSVFTQISSGANDMFLGFDSNTSMQTVQSDTGLYFSTGASFTERLRITSTGNVGIGTSSPNAKLDVEGNIIISGAGYGLLTRSSNSASGSNTGFIRFDGTHTPSGTIYTGPSINAIKADTGYATNLTFITTTNTGANNERMRIDDSGNVGIGTSSPATKLDVTGTVRASTGILFGSDTAAANTLDDYEEGTFTPVASAGVSTNSGTPAYSGFYTKVGRLVHITIRQTAGNITVAIGQVFTGLPFLPGSDLQACSITNGDPNISGTGLIYSTGSAGQVYAGFAAASQTTYVVTGTYFT
jgi:hypothetical protein